MNYKKTFHFLIIFIVIGAISFSINRDLLIEKEGTVDLRNRVVGSRLQKDGILPYYFKWLPGDSIRYYDPCNIEKDNLSNITASPFFHTLLYPIADIPQRQISRLWLFFEYLSILLITFFSYRLCSSKQQKKMVVITSVLFTYTEAWSIHIVCGQLYLIIPLCGMLFYYIMHRDDNGTTKGVFAGIITCTLILIRPNAIVFFLPFLFLINNYNRRFLLAFFSACVFLPAIYFSSSENRLFWEDYDKAIKESIIAHQLAIIDKPFIGSNDVIKLISWEGWNQAQIEKDEISNNFKYYSENGNVFVLYYHIFKKRIPINVMMILTVVTISILMVAFYWAGKKHQLFSLPNAAILGTCLYMITDLNSPIWRHQYNTVQWLFPLLVAASVYKKEYKKFYILIGLGIFLNIINTSAIKMEHTIGEYLILVILLLMSLTLNLKTSK